MLTRNLTTSQIQIRILLVTALALALSAATARAAALISFDEFGNGVYQSTAGPVPLPLLGNIVDPVDPGNGLFPLAYNLAAVLGGVVPTSGDIDVVETTGVGSDLLRFAPNGWLIVYSDLPEAGENPVPPADVGVPQLRQLNNISLLEMGPEAGPNGLFGYIPNFGDPGWIPVPPGPGSYDFYSDGAVPEPASMGSALFGVFALLARRRR